VVTPAAPTESVVAPQTDCQREMGDARQGGKVVRKVFIVPPAPGLEAQRDGPRTVRAIITFKSLPERCKPAVVLVTLDVNSDGAPGVTRHFRVRSETMRLRLPTPDGLPRPDAVHASAYTKRGLRSDTVSVLVR
jgi:hypothetical protein